MEQLTVWRWTVFQKRRMKKTYDVIPDVGHGLLVKITKECLMLVIGWAPSRKGEKEELLRNLLGETSKRRYWTNEKLRHTRSQPKEVTSRSCLHQWKPLPKPSEDSERITGLGERKRLHLRLGQDRTHLPTGKRRQSSDCSDVNGPNLRLVRSNPF